MTGQHNIKTKFFISYAHEHEKCAKFFKKEIENLYGGTAEVFVAVDPQCILPSERWHHKIINELQDSTAIFALLSPISAIRVWLSFEVGAAIALKKKVFPLRFADLRDSDVPSTLTELQSWDLKKCHGLEQIFLSLDTELKPTKERIKQTSLKISKYFHSVKGDDWTRLFLPPLEVRLRFLGNLSEKQYRLFHMVSRLESKLPPEKKKKGGVPRSTIREKFLLQFHSKIDEEDKQIQISDSEYYYRLRELYFLGLLDMKNMDDLENVWSVNKDVRSALFGER